MIITTNLLQLNTTQRQEIIDITAKVQKIVGESAVSDGLVTIYTKHTTTAVRINENDPLLVKDFHNFLRDFVHDDRHYFHNQIAWRHCPPQEQLNAAAHLRALFLGASETILLRRGKMLLGKWQAIFFVELDGGRSDRQVVV